MSQPTTHALLNRLLAIVGRSFPQYMQYSRPYVPAGCSHLVEALAAVVSDQDVMDERISQMLSDENTAPRFGEFPMEFTDLHDLDINFLFGEAARYQELDIAKVGEIVDQLQLAPAAQSLAEETLGMTKGHFDSMREKNNAEG